MLVLILFSAGVFLTAALLLGTLFGGKDKAAKQTMERLEAINLVRQNRRNEPDGFDVQRQDALSKNAWLDQILSRIDLVQPIRLMLYQADLGWKADTLLQWVLICSSVLGLVVYWRTENLFLAFLLAVAGGSLPFLYVRLKRNQRFEKLKERLPESLDLMVSANRAGHSFTSAMSLAAKESPEPVKREFRQCFDEQNFGLDLRTAMNNLTCRAPIREIRMIVTAVLIQKEAGGNLTEILDKVSYLIREDYRIQRQIRVHTAQGRLTGWILTFAPIALGVLLYLLNPENMSVLWKRPVGIKLIEAAVVMELIGGLLIRKIVHPKI